MGNSSTASALRAVSVRGQDTVLPRGELAAAGYRSWDVRRQLEAGRWQCFGRAVVLHGGPLLREDQIRVALVNCGPRALLTSFTALDAAGLEGWERPAVHVLVPAGVARPRPIPVPLVLHRTGSWTAVRTIGTQRQTSSQAALVAAAGFGSARPACGLLAALVQQRLVRAADLRAALDESTRVRHRAALLSAVDDIAMGSHALSEIDFVRLCRRNGLPVPNRQAVRRERSGRRRYLDAEWVLPGGRRLAVEVDGALHLAPRRWFEDQLRQNEVVIAGTPTLRFPSVIIRSEEALVVDQLRRALFRRS